MLEDVNAAVIRNGEAVAVMAAIAGARLAGAHTIIAVDLDSRKLELAKEFGATHTVDSSSTDPVSVPAKFVMLFRIGS